MIKFHRLIRTQFKQFSQTVVFWLVWMGVNKKHTYLNARKEFAHHCHTVPCQQLEFCFEYLWCGILADYVFHCFMAITVFLKSLIGQSCSDKSSSIQRGRECFPKPIGIECVTRYEPLAIFGYGLIEKIYEVFLS